MTSTPSFADLGVPAALVDGARRRRHHHAVPDPDRHAARLAGRPRRARPRPDRLGQDLRVRAPAAGPARRRHGQAPARPPPRADPRPDPRARHPDPRGHRAAGRARSACAPLTVFGGVAPDPQIQGLRTGVDIVVACPGRLEDHVQTGHADLDAVEITVLDEADHMADLGFLPAVTPAARPDPAATASGCCSRPPSTPASTCSSSGSCTTRSRTASTRRSRRSPTMTHHVLHVAGRTASPVLVDLTAAPGRTLVFTRTKHGAKTLTRQLIARGVPAVELHGNLAQNARTRNLAAFSDGIARRRWSPPTSRPAASTSTTSASSSTPTRRSSTRPTCTAPAVPPAPAPRAPSSR